MPSPIDPRKLRNAFGKFATGVTIITTVESNGTPRGFTANSFTSVSLDPPLLLVCIDKSAASLPVFLEGKGFAVNILVEAQKNAAGLFASHRADKFNNVPWHSGRLGMPLIDDVLAWFECVSENHVDAGDHVILIGRITDFDYRNAQPLGYAGGGYFNLGLEQSLVDVASKGTGIIIGAVLEQDGSLLLKEDDKTSKVSVPAIGRDGTQPSLPKLVKELSSGHLSVSIDFLFAVYEDLKTGVHVVYYRGTASGPALAGTRFFSFDEIPWDRLIDDPTHSMLERYVREFKYGNFAIYMGDDIEGKVRALDTKTAGSDT